MEPVPVAIITLSAYALGSIPSAYIAGRLARGIDIRTVGSLNAGALNTFHQAGPAAAIAVLVADTLKGSLAVLLAVALSGSAWACLFGAVGVVAGHNWPVFLGFRGGKGVATALGVSLVVLPWLTVTAVVPAVLVIVLTRNVVIGATMGFAMLNVLIVVTGQGTVQIALCVLITLVVAATYLGRSWDDTVAAVQQRRWMALFAFE